MAKRKPKKPGNDYDKIFKENLEPLILPLIRRRYGLDIKDKRRLPDKIQTTTERETDFLFEISDSAGKKSLLHIEFQSRNDKNMVFRNQEYHGIISRKYKLPIRHYVFYIGRRKPNMMSQLPEDMQFKGFEILDFNTLSYRDFLDSKTGSEIILAILADFQGHAPEAVIRLILQQLRVVVRHPASLKKYVEQLNILSRLRNLSEQTIKIAASMPITIDIEKDYLYRIGLDRGIELERQKAEAELELERQKAEVEIELERRKAEEERSEREKAEAEIETERRRAEEAEAEKLDAIIALYETGLSISTISQVFRMTEEDIQRIIAAGRQPEME